MQTIQNAPKITQKQILPNSMRRHFSMEIPKKNKIPNYTKLHNRKIKRIM